MCVRKRFRPLLLASLPNDLTDSIRITDHMMIHGTRFTAVVATTRTKQQDKQTATTTECVACVPGLLRLSLASDGARDDWGLKSRSRHPLTNEVHKANVSTQRPWLQNHSFFVLSSIFTRPAVPVRALGVYAAESLSLASNVSAPAPTEQGVLFVSISYVAETCPSWPVNSSGLLSMQPSFSSRPSWRLLLCLLPVLPPCPRRTQGEPSSLTR